MFMGYRDNHHITMPYLSKEGLEMEMLLKALSDEYGYKKLPKEKSVQQRCFYLSKLDSFWKNDEFLKYDIQLTTHNGTVLANGVSSRGYVCGDYGVFLEIENSQIDRKNLMVQPGEEYRLHDVKYKDNVKYYWYTDKENNGIKLYYQQKGVTYADYKAGKWYVSPYEVKIVKVRKKDKDVKVSLKPKHMEKPLVVQNNLFEK